MRWSWPALFTLATPMCVPVTTLPTGLPALSPSGFGEGGGPARRMVRGRRILRGESREDRVAGRAQLGPLVDLLVSRMRQQYAAAVWYFVRCMVSLFDVVSDDFTILDQQIQYFLCQIWAEGEPKSLAAHTICGLQHFLNVKRTFPGAWRLYAAWDKAEIPQRAPPLPSEVVLGIAGWLLQEEV